MGKVIDWIKDHPYLTAGGVFLIGLIFVFSMQGGSTETVSTGTPYVPAPDQSLNQANIAAQVASKQIEAEKEIRLGEQNTAWKIASAQFDQANNANILTAGVKSLDIRESNITQRASDALAAQVAQANLATQVSIAQIGANRDVTIAGYQKEVEVHSISTNANVAVHQLNVQGRQNEINQMAETNRLLAREDTTRYLAGLIAGGANARLLQ